MGQISSLFAHKVASAAAPRDTARRSRLLRGLGIDPDAPIDPGLMVPDTDYYALCERAAREDAEGYSLSVRVGSSMRCDDYGAFGLAWKTAPNLRASYARAERYGLVLTSVSTYEVIDDGDHTFMRLNRDGERHLGMRLSNEQTLVAVTQISREVSVEPFFPVAVHFRHPPPVNLSAHEAYFGCPLVFSSDRDALQIDPARFGVPNKLGDEAVSGFFDAHLDREVEELAADSALAGQVRARITRSLSEGVPTMSQVAARLGTSGRTLQRRLGEQGYTFQTLVDDARRELSEDLLRATDYSLAEIAFLTGFAEQSSFTRAFKRWAGQTPRSFRLKATGP